MTIIVATVVLATLVLLHTPYVNGPEHWQWTWRRLPAIRWYLILFIASLPVAAALLIFFRTHRIALPLCLLILGSIALKLASVAAVQPPTGMSLMADIVRSREATSYFIDAAALSNYKGWFAAYDEVLPRTGLHTRSKPPGPLLYWSGFIRAFGYTDKAAIAGGLTLAVLAALAIPATWWLVRLLTGSGEAAFIAAAVLAFCPGYELFFPMLDPVYIVIACAMIGVWHLIITRDSVVFAATFGLTLVGATMVSYPLLSLGFFLLLYGLVGTARPLSQSSMISLRHGTVVLLTLTLAYLILWFFTGYDPIATFASAWRNQYGFLAQHESDRRYPFTIPFDLLDFALGAAWIPIAAAIMYVSRSDAERRKLALLCLAQVLVVAATGLVQSETARVWAFMLPLLLIPASLELARWTPSQRAVFFACLWLLMVVIGQNMTFVNPG